ncbi:hypothetical protein DDQ68_16110 [Hymenobacter nivis]|uniref:Uncharacterized protein n=1 Tax=Hymenobacter nivis TaxID=1850093 RepID=A0A2Z3GXS1_9BACT|nr:hypothetical protein DDQ68_16110 [Hymenobacter nivis]
MDCVWKRALNRLDEMASLIHLGAAVPERLALMVSMFHVLFGNANEMERYKVDPQQRITTGITNV